MIELQDICKAYHLGKHDHFVLRNIDFKVERSELLAIMGASGSGKSTMMNIIGLLDQPSLGAYYFDGVNVAGLSEDERAELRNKALGFVFQSFFLLPRLTVLQNVSLPLQYANEAITDGHERCLRLLERVGMLDHVKKKPNQLSGGQQQRVAIARALVMNPLVILADEPTGALDSKIGQEVMDLFIKLNREEKRTVIIITHDENIARQCQRMVRIHDGMIVRESG